MAVTILVVDDERNIVQLARIYLEKEGFQVESAANGRQALEKVQSTRPDLVVLDLMLPELDGWEVCRRLRKDSNLPIIMVTARDDDIDKIVGLELGADDYLTKPFNPRELVARVKALLRRAAASQAPARVLRFLDLELELDRRETRLAGQPIALRPKEFDLLATLTGSPGVVFERERLIQLAWGHDYIGDTRTVDVTSPGCATSSPVARPASRPSGASVTSWWMGRSSRPEPRPAAAAVRGATSHPRIPIETLTRFDLAPPARSNQFNGPGTRGRRLRFVGASLSSLRARLTIAFVAIIVVTLLLASSAFVLILRDEQLRRETARVAELTGPLTNQVRSLEALGATTPEIVDYLERQADDLDLRLVLANGRGTIFADSADTLVGQQLQIQPVVRTTAGRRLRQATIMDSTGELLFLVSPSINADRQAAADDPAGPVRDRFQNRSSAYIIGISVPRQSLATAWLELLPQLSLAALAALALSIAAAWPLAASIARPLARMTRAAEALAEGRFDQQIPSRGRDEVARLAVAFNRMAREIQASQRTLRDFIANVSHDLRTPLTSVQGFSQALLDGTLAEREQIAEAGRIINAESERMSRLVSDLLELARMESGRSPLERQAVNLTQLVAARVEAATGRAAETDITFRFTPTATPLIAGDPLRLERVVDNLLDNARRHTPAGGVVTVRVEHGRGVVPDEGRTGAPWTSAGSTSPAIPLPRSVLVTVHNSGSTIHPEDLPRLFERFYQVDKARAAGGSGLGLAICQEIVQAHGGRCWAESSAASGTRFCIELPAAVTIPPGDPAARPSNAQRPGAAVQRGAT